MRRTGDTNDAKTVEAKIARALGARLRKAREQKGWSRQKVARAAHIDPSWLYKIETGKHRPSWHLAANLAELLGVPQSDIEALFVLLNPPIAKLREELGGGAVACHRRRQRSDHADHRAAGNGACRRADSTRHAKKTGPGAGTWSRTRSRARAQSRKTVRRGPFPPR